MLHITEPSSAITGWRGLATFSEGNPRDHNAHVIPLVQESPAGKATKEPEACSEHKFHNSTDFKIKFKLNRQRKKELCSFYNAVCSLMVDNGYCDVLAITNILTDIHNH